MKFFRNEQEKNVNETDKELVKKDIITNTLKDKFAIPVTLDIKNTVNQVSFSEKYVIPEFENKNLTEKIPAETIKSIELVDEVPKDVVLDDGIELVRELSPEVEKHLDDIVKTDPKLPVEKIEEDSTINDESWDKFVDHVILPTLNTCIDKVKEFVSTNLAEDLKKSKPDIKE